MLKIEADFTDQGWELTMTGQLIEDPRTYVYERLPPLMAKIRAAVEALDPENVAAPAKA